MSNVLVAGLVVFLGDQLGVGGQLSTGGRRRARHPDLLQRRRDPPAPVQGMTAPRPAPRAAHGVGRRALRPAAPAAAPRRRRRRACCWPRSASRRSCRCARRRRTGVLAAARQEDLVQILDDLSNRNDRLRAEVDALDGRPGERLDQPPTPTPGGARRGPRGARSCSACSPARSPATGPGVVLTVDDPDGGVRAEVAARRARGAAGRRRRGAAARGRRRRTASGRGARGRQHRLRRRRRAASLVDGARAAAAVPLPRRRRPGARWPRRCGIPGGRRRHGRAARRHGARRARRRRAR